MKSLRAIIYLLLSINLISCSQEITSSSDNQLPVVTVDPQSEAAFHGHNHNHGHNSAENNKTDQPKKNPGDRKGDKMEEVVPRELIPPAPILNIEQALAAFEVHQDFELQVVAKEPLLFDPIMIQYDAAGRIWAVEMTTFMKDVEGTGKFLKESQIVVLTDTDNDGEMDKRQVILEKIMLPRAFAFVTGGILWADNEKLYFTELEAAKSKPHDFVVIQTEVVDATYAKGGNLEHKTNGLLFSLDNWYYSAKSSTRYRPYPLNSEVPQQATEVYRNHLWKMVKTATEFRGQFGLTQDDYGRHYFNVNSTPILTTSFIPNASLGNPKHKVAKTLLAQKVGTTDVYPVRVTPGINRGYKAENYSKDFKLKTHTSACGPLFYRGNQFAAHYYGIGLAQEPAANLVKATKLTDTNGVVSGENLFLEQEIIASTDERFRPVNAVNAPDGTITLVDFYHGIIQDRTFLTSYLADQIKQRDLERNQHIGRLYRIKYKNKPLPKVTYLDNLSAQALVPFLAHDNGWHRDMAQQLLVMKQDFSAIDDLKKMAKSHANHLAQIKALWTLEGLNAIDFETLKTASQTDNNKVKVSIYRLAQLQATSEHFKHWLLDEVKVVNAETYSALALAAGAHKAWPVLTEIINQFGLNDFILVSLGNQEADYLNAQGTKISTAANQKITELSSLVLKTKKAKTYSKVVNAQIKHGKTLFNGQAGCFGCHGADGEGNQFVPPLNNSHWVTGSEKRLTAILLHGLAGPIKVNGKLYETPMTMPGLANNSAFTDADLAAIASYIRTEWDNNAAPVTTKTITLMREKTQQQQSTYTVDTVNALK
ncbi:MAG: PVC-type heme-binding CxxCH protein [Thalassotalea sp.]